MCLEFLEKFDVFIFDSENRFEWFFKKNCKLLKLYPNIRCYDRNYHGEELVLRACDADFEECIEWSYKKQSWICAKFLEFTHSGAVRLFSGIYR